MYDTLYHLPKSRRISPAHKIQWDSRRSKYQQSVNYRISTKQSHVVGFGKNEVFDGTQGFWRVKLPTREHEEEEDIERQNFQHVLF
ncbi:hypothetical protein Leryth_015797 [Lithospermum erythrorhizon]|nr:hypothetical protein Leryth_015797 [Lithospermum erythrorhizon]